MIDSTERHVRERNPEEVIISLRELADEALAILEPGENYVVGVGAINETLSRLESARQSFVARGLTDYAKDCAQLIEKLKSALVDKNPKAKAEAVKKLHQLADGD